MPKHAPAAILSMASALRAEPGQGAGSTPAGSGCGATAALGVNDYAFGRTTGKMVYRILSGEPVNQVKPEVMNELTLFVSPSHAKAQGVTLSDDLLKDAVNVDEKAQPTK